MKLALLSIFLALPVAAQPSLRVVVKPLADKETRRLIGSKDHTLWTVTVHSGFALVRRNDVTALLSISELPIGIDSAAVIRESDGSEITLAGKLWQKASPSVGDVALGFGLSSGSPWLIGIGAGVKFGNMIWDAIKGQAPDPAKIVTLLMPKLMECPEGDCGQYFLITARDPSAKMFEVPVRVPQVIGLEPPKSSSEPKISLRPNWDSIQEGCIRFGDTAISCSMTGTISSEEWCQKIGTTTNPCSVTGTGMISPLSTHPQVPDEQDAYLATLERMIREHSAQIGDGQ